MTLDSSALMEAADANLIATWRRLLTSADVLVEEDDDLLLASSDTAMAFFNPVFVKRPLDDPEAALERIRAFYGSWREPFLVWSRKGTNDDFVKVAEAANLVANDGPPAMVMQPLAVPTPPAPPPVAGLEIVAVHDAALLGATVDVIAAGFSLPVDVCHQLFTPAFLAVEDLTMFVGRVNGHAVSSATLSVTGDVAGVYNVATPQPNRRHGLGEALTWAALRAGLERGCTVGALQASPMGEPIYARMGFHTVGAYDHLVGGV